VSFEIEACQKWGRGVSRGCAHVRASVIRTCVTGARWHMMCRCARDTSGGAVLVFVSQTDKRNLIGFLTFHPAGGASPSAARPWSTAKSLFVVTHSLCCSSTGDWPWGGKTITRREHLQFTGGELEDVSVSLCVSLSKGGFAILRSKTRFARP